MIYPLAARRGMITPLARGIHRAASGWWLAGGISAANCVAAYQAKGAASYAASKVNLANPGTYNAADGEAYPTWDDTNGWKFVSASQQYLKTGITPNNMNWSAIIRLSNVPVGDQWAFGYYTTQGFGLEPRFKPSAIISTCYYNGGLVYSYADRESGIWAIAKNQGYYNGSPDGTTWSQSTHTAGEVWIGDVSGIYRRYFGGYIQAFALYNATITAEQVSALTTAINAL